MVSNEELLIVLGRQINFDRDQKAAAIDQTAGRDRLYGHPAVDICDTVCGGGELLSEIDATYLQPTHLTTNLSVCLNVCLSIYLSVCLSVCLPACLSVRLSLFIYLFISVCRLMYPHALSL
jgi:hypothetical protein